MRAAILASGSKGNAALIEHGDALVLLDCGISYRQLAYAAESLGVALGEITAVCITHEHSDHVRCLPMLAKRTGLIPYMTRGTAARIGLADGEFRRLVAYEAAELGGGLTANPYTVPHDAQEPVQFVFCADGLRLGFATDVGQLMPRLMECLAGCHALVVESNYDPTMLEGNPRYPRSVKNRIKGGYGHLSNSEAGEMLAEVSHPKLRQVVAAHLSENNNLPQLALETLAGVLQRKKLAAHLQCASQRQPTGWIEVSG